MRLEVRDRRGQGKRGTVSCTERQQLALSGEEFGDLRFPETRRGQQRGQHRSKTLAAGKTFPSPKKYRYAGPEESLHSDHCAEYSCVQY